MTTTALAPFVGGKGARISGSRLTVRHRNGTVALDDVSLAIEPGRLTAIVGPSGAGKTTLLSALAGITPVREGTVTVATSDDGGLGDIGFVPQDDILHGELPLRRTLRYAAKLRMAAPDAAIDAAVDDAIDTLGLANRSDIAVGSLSGGQRKRANIACEILTRPGVCFLDEPTSGLDPSAAADLVKGLKRMAADGSTVVFTTHRIEDIQCSDQVVVMAPGGRLLAVGTPSQVLDDLAAQSFTELYERLASDRPRTDDRPIVATAVHVGPTLGAGHRANRPDTLTQWWTLTRRSVDILTRDRLTVAILLGSPSAVIAMFVVLFKPGAFSGAVDPTAGVQVAYWLSFAGFFFGLTFGLLQVCTEVPVLRRERHAGVRTAAYLASKLAVLTPILLLVNGLMIIVLGSLDRIPDLSLRGLLELNVTMALNAVAALCLGLLASAMVTSTAQAALALPMLCFPAVLFSGAIVPTSAMATTGRAISAVMSDRWAFEAIARRLDVGALTGPGSPYAGLGASSFATYWAMLGAFIALTAAGAYAAVRRRARPK